MNTQRLEDAPPTRFVREAECRQRTGLSRAQRWRLEREGRFPLRVQLSERAFAWVETELQDWIAARVRERDRRERPRAA